jgi:hypothetical protein
LAALAIKLEQQERRQAFEAKKLPSEPASTGSTAPAPTAFAPSRTSSRTGMGTALSPPPCHYSSPSFSSGVSPSTSGKGREEEAVQEVTRISSLKRERYRSQQAWAFQVLSLSAGCDSSAVQKAYRGLMKKLHPDKVHQSEAVSKVLDTLKQAKDICERSVSRQMAPGPPRNLSFSTLCAKSGQRRYRLQWDAPEHREVAPVHKYIVAAFDPAYGRALNIAILEPDYSQELRRFQPIEDLRNYVLAEADLQKMPALWKTHTVSIQVAAANDSGQSGWATLKIPINVPVR